MGRPSTGRECRVKSGQRWAQLLWECTFEKSLKGGKKKHFIYLVTYSFNKYLFGTYLRKKAGKIEIGNF